MDLTKLVLELSEIEKTALKSLKDEKEIAAVELSEKSGLNIDQVRRASQWLVEKDLAGIKELKEIYIVPTKEGKKVLKEGLPERRFLNSLIELKEASFDELMKKSGLERQEFNIALGTNKKNGFVVIVQGKIQLTDVAKEFAGKESAGEVLIKKIENVKRKSEIKEESILTELQRRGLVEEKEDIVRLIKINKNGLEALKTKEFEQERKYDLNAPVKPYYIGKKQPYIQFLEKMRRKLVALGFKEMESPLITQEFFNFDALFQPQNHPARTWTDTYQLKVPTHGDLPYKKAVKAIKAAHEHGGETASTGWGYSWSEEVARKLMPAAHCTAHSSRQIVKGAEIPGKYFAISRCYRPDVLDATHLIEFNQMDGFIAGEGLNFRHLLGMLKEFAIEVAGAKKVKFFPDYYPFTEPSVQLSALHPEMGWIEFAGAGIFRPEMTESLGIKEPVLAWGMGIERLAMFKMGIKDIRYLFSDDLTWLRKAKMM